MKKLFLFFAAMLVTLAVNAQTDFATPYYCAADDGVITGDAPSNKVYLNSTADPHQIEWSDVSKTYTSVITWEVEATRACYITVGLDLGTAVGSNKHIFEVKLLDAEDKELGALEEGPAYTGDGFTDKETVKALSGKLLVPAAGNYKIELRNNRDFCKGSIRNVILTYAGDAPITDFASGYKCSADDGVISGTAPAEKVKLNESADPHQIEWSDVSKTYTSVITWNIIATRACYITVGLDLGTAVSSNKHIFEVKVLNEDGDELGAVEEGPAYTGDGFTDKETVKALDGRILIPAAGNYKIELRNNRDFCKGSIRNVILTYAGDAPAIIAKGEWDGWANELVFTLAKDAKTATAKKTFNKGDEFEFKMIINGDWRGNGWWYKRDVTGAEGITENGKNMKIIADADGEYTFTWTFATNAIEITFPALPEPILPNGFYLVGTFGGEDEWEYASLSAAKKFAATEVEGEYTLNYTLAKDDRFKAVYVENDTYKTWYPEGTGNDYLVTEWTAGEKTIYFRPTYHEAWGGHFYIEANKPEVTYSDFEIDLRAGQLGTDKETPNNKYLAINGEEYIYTDAMPFAYNAYLTNDKYNGNQHGYTNLVVTMPVEAGNYKVTLGTCQFGTGTGSIMKADGSVTYKTFDQKAAACYDANTETNVISVVFSVAEAQMIKIVCGNFTPYIKVEQVANIEYAVTFAVEEGVRGIVPSPVAIVKGESLTIPANTTLYLDGYTLTGWTDGENTYAPGDAFTPEADATLTAVFAENTASLLTATVPVTVQWNFGLTEGAPTVAWEGENKGMGFLVAQATIGETKVDVPLDIDARSGKFANSGRKDYWAQVNAGTKLYFPAKKGAEVEVFTYADPATTTVDKANQTGTWTDNKSQFITTATIDASIMEVQGNSYYRYLKVTYPASEATAISNTGAEVKAQKVIENGQIFILKNGVKYNVLGASVK